MCPVCIATATVTWMTVGATSTGGISALVVSKLRGKVQQPTSLNLDDEQGDEDGKH
jgi:hypothetical protein